MWRIKHKDTGKYYSRKWNNPTFTSTGKIFSSIKSAENNIKKIQSYYSRSKMYDTCLEIEELK